MAWNHSKYFEWRLLREPHHKHLQYPSTSRKCLKSKSWLTHVRRDAAPPDPGQQPRRITVFRDQDIDIGTLSDIFADDLRVCRFVSWTQDRDRLVGWFLCIFLAVYLQKVSVAREKDHILDGISRLNPRTSSCSAARHRSQLSYHLN
jgi:hypothetical protein